MSPFPTIDGRERCAQETRHALLREIERRSDLSEPLWRERNHDQSFPQGREFVNQKL
jgi:hypothetical protein